MSKLEVYVSETRLTIAKGHTIAEFSIDADRQLHVRVPPEVIGEVVWETDVVLAATPLQVDVIVYEKEDSAVALPRTRAQRKTATTETIRPARRAKPSRTYLSRTDGITDPQKEKVLNMVLRSLKRNPHQSRAEVAAESHRIADACGVGVMAVAGVRANLTRGAYGDPKKLIKDS